MHALQGHMFDANLGYVPGFAVLETDERLVRLKAILPLACKTAGVAADALRGIDQHSITGHVYAPTFLTLTIASCEQMPP